MIADFMSPLECWIAVGAVMGILLLFIIACVWDNPTIDDPEE